MNKTFALNKKLLSEMKIQSKYYILVLAHFSFTPVYMLVSRLCKVVIFNQSVGVGPVG